MPAILYAARVSGQTRTMSPSKASWDDVTTLRLFLPGPGRADVIHCSVTWQRHLPDWELIRLS